MTARPIPGDVPLPCEGMPEPAPKPARPTTPKPATSGVRWVRTRRSPGRCDRCVDANIRGTSTHAAYPAQWRRITSDGDLQLCHEHAESRQREDGYRPGRGVR